MQLVGIIGFKAFVLSTFKGDLVSTIRSTLQTSAQNTTLFYVLFSTFLLLYAFSIQWKMQ